jgi:hypothetical protein
MGITNEIRSVAAAAAERAELAAAQDAELMRVVAEFRKRLASAETTGQELRNAAKLADELGALAGPRLELAAHEAEIIGQVLAVSGASPTRWLSVLRSQVAHVEALTSTLRVTIEILDARAEVAARLRSDEA